MKTAMKRLLSFVLVAMMLVSVLPFQASADTTTYTVTLNKQAEGEGEVNVGKFTYNKDESVTKADLLSKAGIEASAVNSVWYRAENVADAGPMSDSFTITENMVVAIHYKKPDVTWNATVTFPGSSSWTWSQTYSAAESNATKAMTDATAAFTAAVTAGTVDSVNYTWPENWTVNGQSLTMAATAKTYKITLTIDGNLYDEIEAAYKSTVTLQSDLDSNLFERGVWTSAGASDVPDGGTLQVSGNAVYNLNPVSNGWQTSQLWEKKTVNGEYERAGVVYWKSGSEISNWKDGSNLSDTVTFDEWNSKRDGSGYTLPSGFLAGDKILQPDYYAQYKTKYNNGESKVTVHASYFVDGILHHTAENIFTMEVKTGDKIFGEKYLGNQGNIDVIEDRVDVYKKTLGLAKWNGGFYTDEDCEKAASSTLTATGTTNIYIRIDADKAEIASVHLYVHKKVSSTYVDIIKMPGYLAGDLVTAKDAIAAVKAADWRATEYKLYSDAQWEHMLAGATSVGDVSSVTVEADGSVDIHILLDNGYKTGGTASSNPKTGDTILMAGGVLGVSAAALAVLYFLNKKKQAI